MCTSYRSIIVTLNRSQVNTNERVTELRELGAGTPPKRDGDGGGEDMRLTL